MPVGVIAAGVTAAATIGGAVLSSSAQHHAATTAANTAASNTAANNALTTQMYGNNASRLDPTISGGLMAGNALSGMLLGPASAAAPTGGGTAGGGFGGTGGSGPTLAQIMAMQNDGTPGNFAPALSAYAGSNPGAPAGYNGPSLQQIQAMQNDGIPGNFQPAMNAYMAAQQSQINGAQTNPGGIVGTVGATTPTSALSPWDQFRNSTNYQWRLDQGNRALNQGYAARGTLQSGAAQIGLLEYNQNFAANELGHYQDLLAQQQGFGLTAASALAGVGQGMVSQVTANNNSAASAAANAALAGGQANANMYGGIASGIGTIAGAFGSSYGSTPSYAAPVGGYASAIGSYGW